MLDDKEKIEDILRAGAQGYLLKNAGKTDLKNAIAAVHLNGQFFCSETAKILRTENNHYSIAKENTILSAREIEVLVLVCKGFSNRAISEKLFISPNTVLGHRDKLREKTGSQNVAGLIVYALRNGLFKV